MDADVDVNVDVEVKMPSIWIELEVSILRENTAEKNRMNCVRLLRSPDKTRPCR